MLNLDDNRTNFADIAAAARWAALFDTKADPDLPEPPHLAALLAEPYLKDVPVAALRLLCWSYNQATDQENKE